MKIYIADTERNGKGIFAGEEIAPKSLIFIVEGILQHQSYEPERYMVGKYWLGVGHETWLDTPKHNPMYYTNHSCQPNAALEDRVKVIALQHIKKDHEITIDYALTEEDPYWKMECHCGEQNCRKLIVSTARF